MADVLYTNVGGILVAEDRGGVYSNYLSDTLGSVRKIFSGGASAVTDTFTYWPYGEEFSRTGTNPTPFTWVGTLGYFRDAAKRFYVRMRSYLASVGSWMRVDPLWPIERAYGYVGGRAVDAVDPWGLCGTFGGACDHFDTCEESYACCLDEATALWIVRSTLAGVAAATALAIAGLCLGTGVGSGGTLGLPAIICIAAMAGVTTVAIASLLGAALLYLWDRARCSQAFIDCKECKCDNSPAPPNVMPAPPIVKPRRQRGNPVVPGQGGAPVGPPRYL